MTDWDVWAGMIRLLAVSVVATFYTCLGLVLAIQLVRMVAA